MTRPKDVNAPSRWNMRIWDDDKHEWLCQSDEDALTYYGFDITGGETTEFQGLPKWHPSRHYIWEQSTGLKDKNGKEIYEGDIVRYADDYEENAEVVFDDGGFQVEWPINIERLEGDITCMMEAIGNIHENPELMEGAE